MRGGDKGAAPVSEVEEENRIDSDAEATSSNENMEIDNSVTWERIQDLIFGMKDNINENTNAAIGDIKSDVTQIKSQIERYNETMEEVQGRISIVEDRMVGYEDLKQEISHLKRANQGYEKEKQMEACRARRNNIIINGIPGTSKDKEDVKKAFRTFIIEGLELGEEWLEKVELEDLYRFPSKKKDETSWPVFVRVEKLKYKDEMYKAAPNLKGKDRSMRNDLAPWLLVERNKLYTESDRLRAAPHNLKTRTRDTYCKVWLEVRKDAGEKWKTWDGKT